MDLAGKKILLTGATGLIGGEIFYRLPKKENVFVLCRDIKSAKEKLIERQRSIIDNRNSTKRFNIIQGDITKSNWGLQEFNYDIVIHCAANTSFIGGKECQGANILGTRNIIDLIHQCHEKPFLVYIGTAASCGSINDMTINESFLGASRHFNNYTRSKQIAEAMVRKSLHNYLIVRPTIVLGDNIKNIRLASSIGWAFFIVRYFDELPFNPNSCMDYVAVSSVGKIIIDLMKKEKLQHKEYFISCGNRGNIRVKAIIEFLDRLACKKKTLLKQSLVARFEKGQRKIFRRLNYYTPFINMNVIFDNSRLLGELPGVEKRPNLFEYLQFIVEQLNEKHALCSSTNP